MGKHWKQWNIIYLGSNISEDGDCSHLNSKILAPWKRSYDKSRQCIKKKRHHFASKGQYSQSYGFSSSHVWMWELDHKEDWAPKFDASELWCWRRLLRVPWTASRSNYSILKEINPDYSLERLMLKLRFQYFGHLVKRAESLEKTLMLEKIEGRRRRGRQRMRRLNCITNSIVWEHSRGWWGTGKPGVLQSVRLQRVGHTWVIE